MLEYAVAIHHEFDRFPEQLVLYVGEAPLSMSGRLAGGGLSYECRIGDIREMDGETLLSSESLEDNVIAILCRLTDEGAALRRILTRIAESAPEVRSQALCELTILTGLRNLALMLEKETERMPILKDIMDHEIIGRERKRGMAIGREIGREEGQRKVVFILVEERFGPVPASARARIEALGEAELEVLAQRLLKAESLAELLG
jgi:hypothetical protein